MKRIRPTYYALAQANIISTETGCLNLNNLSQSFVKKAITQAIIPLRLFIVRFSRSRLRNGLKHLSFGRCNKTGSSDDIIKSLLRYKDDFDVALILSYLNL